MSVVWYGPQVTQQVNNLAGKRVQAAGIQLKNRVREKLSRSQPTIGTGIHKQGLDPSKPGEYPKKVIGHLRRNVADEFDAAAMTSRVGTNVLYGKFLELGTSRMAPRPFLTKGLYEFADELGVIVAGRGARATGDDSISESNNVVGGPS